MQCFDKKYNSYRPWVLAGSVFYGLGMPITFHFLSKKFKPIAQRYHDKVISNALGFIYEPFREGFEFWFGLEMIRVMLLTSTVGFAQSCHMKILVANFLAFLFLIFFLVKRPCTLPKLLSLSVEFGGRLR